MSVYRFLSTNLLTGQIMGDWLPVTAQNFVRRINATGAFTGALNLTAGMPAEQRAYLAAVEPERSVLWAFQDSAPVWCGIIWDWPHQSILDNTLPISASTMESLFSRRLIEDDLTFTSADVFDIFRALASYALAKTPNGQVAGWTMGSNESGITVSVSYLASNQGTVAAAWSDLAAAYNFEYSVRPAVDASGNVYMSLDLGYPVLGLPLTSSGLAFSMPGNLLDYRFTRTGSTSSNKITATAPASPAGPALNQNSDFVTGTSPWVGNNDAAVAQSSAWGATGTYSIVFTGDGSTLNPELWSESIPVTPGTPYNMTATAFSPQGWATTRIELYWQTSALTTAGDAAGSTVDVTAGVTAGTALNCSSVSTADAAYCQVRITMLGTPASSVQMYITDAVFQISPGPSWISDLPHGEDLNVLGDGYPLLETSVSLSTVIVTSQAQINAYADGLLPALTGTQLIPMLTLGAGQIPAVKDITLGSYCQFTATSPLHPAQPDGSPGLQINGRVIGWTLYPPSSQQSEYSELQLGEITDVDGTTYTPFTGATPGG